MEGNYKRDPFVGNRLLIRKSVFPGNPTSSIYFPSNMSLIVTPLYQLTAQFLVPLIEQIIC